MTTVQSGTGLIDLFEDFTGPEEIFAETHASGNIGGGPFRVVGDGLTDASADSGVAIDEATAPLNGVGILTTTNEDKHGTYIATAKALDVATMGPIVMECRVQFADLDAKAFFFGLCSVNEDALSLEDDVVVGSGTTIAYNASAEMCAFYYDEALTDDEDWHTIYTGGVAAAVTDSTAIDLDNKAVLGEWQVLKMEVDPSGTARFFIDNDLLSTVVGAVSTTTDLAMVCGVEARASTNELAYIDYVSLRANRNWTV